MLVVNACSPNPPASPTVSGRASDVATAIASNPPPDSTDTGSQPPLNILETKIVSTLGALGIEGQRAELPFAGAVIWAQFDGGLELFVSAYPAGIGSDEFTVLGERQIAGLTVQRVDYGSELIRDRFACADVTYTVDGAAPPGFADMEEFLARFIEALDCA